MAKKAGSEKYAANMERIYGPDWRSIFREAQKKSGGGFAANRKLASEAGKKGSARAKELYGKDFYANILKANWRKKKQPAQDQAGIPKDKP